MADFEHVDLTNVIIDGDPYGVADEGGAFNSAYPLHSIYMSTVNQNPSIYFGGTWTQKATSPYYTWERTK